MGKRNTKKMLKVLNSRLQPFLSVTGFNIANFEREVSQIAVSDVIRCFVNGRRYEGRGPDIHDILIFSEYMKLQTGCKCF